MDLTISDRLAQPEVLSDDTLRKLLVQRDVQPKDLPSDHGGLLDLYKRLILPLPQRDYNTSTRLGRKLCQKKSSSSCSPQKLNSSKQVNEASRKQPSNGYSESPSLRDNLKRRLNISGEAAEYVQGKKPRERITWP